MVKIDSTEFGKIVVDGKTYDSDITIDAKGIVAKRSNASERWYGTHHVICTEEIKDLLVSKPQVLVVGLGQFKACRLEQGAEKSCEKYGTKLVAEPTPKAIKIFNETAARKAGLFHITC
ncbi:MAG: MTH938/NDUFAF3 family protein [Candidatus Pacearchaeota archaeon]|nr:MTH938/NDUFAF3 family protein [Candidatus Pacearchaeota archaeon]